jgi:hypothetical protein
MLNPVRRVLSLLLQPAVAHCSVIDALELQFENARSGVPVTSVDGTSRVANVIPCLNSHPGTRSVIVIPVAHHAANVSHPLVMMTILRSRCCRQQLLPCKSGRKRIVEA